MNLERFSNKSKRSHFLHTDEMSTHTRSLELPDGERERFVYVLHPLNKQHANGDLIFRVLVGSTLGGIHKSA